MLVMDTGRRFRQNCKSVASRHEKLRSEPSTAIGRSIANAARPLRSTAGPCACVRLARHLPFSLAFPNARVRPGLAGFRPCRYTAALPQQRHHAVRAPGVQPGSTPYKEAALSVELRPRNSCLTFSRPGVFGRPGESTGPPARTFAGSSRSRRVFQVCPCSCVCLTLLLLDQLLHSRPVFNRGYEFERLLNDGLASKEVRTRSAFVARSSPHPRRPVDLSSAAASPRPARSSWWSCSGVPLPCSRTRQPRPRVRAVLLPEDAYLCSYPLICSIRSKEPNELAHTIRVSAKSNETLCEPRPRQESSLACTAGRRRVPLKDKDSGRAALIRLRIQSRFAALRAGPWDEAEGREVACSSAQTCHSRSRKRAGASDSGRCGQPRCEP